MAHNYKETLNLPRTDFPMKANLAAREPEMLARWQRDRVYEQIQNARAEAELFVLHDGPPFANGDVHMGTALNKILKDMIVKSRTMLGFRAPFVPGWDCHGLPIEYKVVKEARGLAPAEVRKRCEEFARRFVDIQREQFKRLGVFGDWEHPYLTMSPSYEADILRAFADFVELGLVYESRKPVFWSTGAQTALAVAEVEYHDREDTAVYVKFPIVSGELAGKASMAIWTTTPWTLPANLAIAVHPNELYVRQEFRPVAAVAGRGDEMSAAPRPATAATTTLVLAASLVDRFCLATGFQPTGEPLSSFPGSALARLEAQHPFLSRRSIVLPAEFVTLESGTGCVHIAPGHGEEDYSLGREFNLEVLSPVDDHGRFTDEAEVPALVGKYVFEANKDIVEILRQRDALLASETYRHSYPYCWRSKTPIIFRAVEQFFIRLDELRGKALDAITKVTWIPLWGENRIAGTVESRPDWVISRQRSWGVPLPVFYNAAGQSLLRAEWIRRLADLVGKRGSNVWFELTDEELACELELPAGLSKRNDTIDVWIDSGLSHKAVCASRPELHDPAEVYIEATDQHRGWFQSSLMTSVALHNRAPYKTCITHGFVVDVDGRKISKSSSYEKPMDAMHFLNKHGADILRLWVSSVNYTDDVPFSEEMFSRLGDTYRRIRNTLRILHGNLFDFTLEGDAPSSPGRGGARPSTLIDRWILSRLDDVVVECRNAYERYEFHKVYHTINDFCAVDLSSLYIDMTKDRMYCDAADGERRRATQSAMREIYDALCRLLAPILVFTAEEAWHYLGAAGSIHAQLFPLPRGRRDEHAETTMKEALALREKVTRELEQARQHKIIGNSLEAKVCIELQRNKLAHNWFDDLSTLEEVLIVSDLRLVDGMETKAVVGRTTFAKCARCWRHRESVGANEALPELCGRCEAVVAALSQAKSRNPVP